jgi:hypothetical protein
MNGNALIYRILRYLAQALAIYLLFRFMPELTMGEVATRLSNWDVLLVTVIIMLIYILFENLCSLYTDERVAAAIASPTNMTSTEKTQLCNSVCTVGGGPSAPTMGAGTPGTPGTPSTPATPGAPGASSAPGMPPAGVAVPEGMANQTSVKQITNQKRIEPFGPMGSPVPPEGGLSPMMPPMMPPRIPPMGEHPTLPAQPTEACNTDDTDIAILQLLNKRPHGSKFYRYLQNLKKSVPEEASSQPSQPSRTLSSAVPMPMTPMMPPGYSDYGFLPPMGAQAAYPPVYSPYFG